MKKPTLPNPCVSAPGTCDGRTSQGSYNITPLNVRTFTPDAPSDCWMMRSRRTCQGVATRLKYSDIRRGWDGLAGLEVLSGSKKEFPSELTRRLWRRSPITERIDSSDASIGVLEVVGVLDVEDFAST